MDLVNRFLLAVLAIASLVCIGCSVPPVYNTPSTDGTAWWAYQQCLSTNATASVSATNCNKIGVTNGRSYTDYTFGANLYSNDYQQTDAPFVGKFYRAARVQSYRAYVESLPQDVQEQLKEKWLAAAQGA